MDRLLTLSWLIAIFMMIGIVLSLPVIGGPALIPGEGAPAHMGGAFFVSDVAGMAGPRNTGVARYAGVAALAGLGRLWQTRGWVRVFWIMVVPVSTYVLVSAQGRTEIVAFIGAVFVTLIIRRMSRLVMFSWGLITVWVVVVGGYMERFVQYWTRNRAFDPTLSGRTVTWQQGWEVFDNSPWIGLGFQADRYFLGNHAHNGWLHALLETGLLGTAAFVAAFALALAFMVRLYWLSPDSKRASLAAEVPGILVFFTIMNTAESTAYYSANWMLLAPAVAYLQLEFWKQRLLQFGLARRLRGLAHPRPLMDFGHLG